MKKKIRSIFNITVLLVSCIIANITITLFLGLYNKSVMINTAIASTLVFFIIIVPIYVIRKLPFRGLKISFQKILKYILLLILLKLVYYLFNLLILNNDISYFSKINTQLNIERVFHLFAILVIAPFSEEFLYQGIASEYLLNKKVKPIIIVIVTSIIFGLSHLPGINYFLYFTLFGSLLSIVYIKERNIWYCITLHFLYNLFSIFIF